MSDHYERFGLDPTDVPSASSLFEELRALARMALLGNNPEEYWSLSQNMKIVGKFLPSGDTRNPNNEIYTTSLDNRGSL